MRIIVFLILVISSSCTKTEQQFHTNVVVDTVYVDTAKIKTSIYKGNMHKTTSQGHDSSYYAKVSVTINYFSNTISFLGTPYIRVFTLANTTVYSYQDGAFTENFKFRNDSLFFTRRYGQVYDYNFTGKR